MAPIFAVQPDCGAAAVVRPCSVRAWSGSMSAPCWSDWPGLAWPAWLGLLGQAW